MNTDQTRTTIEKAMVDLNSGMVVADDTTSDSKAIIIAMESEHWAYKAAFVTRVALAVFGASVGEGNALTWARDHRAHHRYTDTDADPYSVHKGLFYAHFGWIIFKQDRSLTGRADVSDLKRDSVVMWQRRNYTSLFFISAFLLPAVVAGAFWNDWWGGLFYAGSLRMFWVQQSTYFVNSVAHYFGDQTYSDRKSPRDNVITAFLTGGERYHNYHHEFPMDYRSGIHLKRFLENEVNMGKHQQSLRNLTCEGKNVKWGIPIDELPSMTREEFEEKSRAGHQLILIKGVVYDVANFVHEHPGGVRFLLENVGKEVSSEFFGGVYNHSYGAENLLASMRYAKLTI
ncbi:putative delta-9 desaturase, partial [Aureobasidium melanogenum]